jgi:hypothetical protein
VTTGWTSPSLAVLVPTHPIQSVPGALYAGEKRRSLKLTAHLQPEPRLKMRGSLPQFPPRLDGVVLNFHYKRCNKEQIQARFGVSHIITDSQSDSRLVGQSVRQTFGRSVSQSVSQSVRHTHTHTQNQSVSQSDSRSVSLSNLALSTQLGLMATFFLFKTKFWFHMLWGVLPDGSVT